MDDGSADTWLTYRLRWSMVLLAASTTFSKGKNDVDAVPLPLPLMVSVAPFPTPDPGHFLNWPLAFALTVDHFLFLQ
jgi:hypothetical protein